MANDVFQAVSTLMAVREYADREVPAEVIERVAEAGRLTASSMNRQPWHFVVVRGRGELGRLAELVPTGRYIDQAAFAVVIAYERDSRFGVSDASRAVQSMMLTAWADGVGSNWTGFAGGLSEVGRHVGLPDGYEVLAVLPFGYPARPVRGKKARRPSSEVISGGRYGEPLRP